ncbi:MAG: hypothetical protein M3Y54_06965 [Bacteroidota bacterium]|nr:hypothetical protein [Bacteroidota bacterium]
MKNFKISLLSLVLFTISSSFGYCQSIVGTWQIGTKQTGETVLDCYVFKADNSFEYRTNTDMGLSRIRAIGGTYIYKKGYVELVVKYTKEVIGGSIERSHITTGNDSWSIEGGVLQKKLIAKPISQPLNIAFDGPSIIVFDEGSKFYKIK